jgi:hypothetical protein
MREQQGACAYASGRGRGLSARVTTTYYNDVEIFIHIGLPLAVLYRNRAKDAIPRCAWLPA